MTTPHTAPISDWIVFLESGSVTMAELIEQFYPLTARRETAKKNVTSRLLDVQKFLEKHEPAKRLNRMKAGLRCSSIFWIEEVK